MSAHDYVRCEYPLPGVMPEMVFQTKDTPAPFLEEYTVTKEGRLIHHEVKYEDRSDPNAKGLHGLIGSMTAVPTGNMVDTNWHGSFNFYGNGLSFVLLFENGTVKAFIHSKDDDD